MATLSRRSTLEVVPDSEPERIQAKILAYEARRATPDSEPENDDDFFAPKSHKQNISSSKRLINGFNRVRPIPPSRPPIETIILSSDTEEELTKVHMPHHILPRRQIQSSNRGGPAIHSPIANKQRRNVSNLVKSRNIPETIELTDTESDSYTKPRNRSPPKMRAIAIGDDETDRVDGSIIDYIPSSRRAVPIFPPNVVNVDGAHSTGKRRLQRRLTPLPPDPTPKGGDDLDDGLSWEHDRDPSGAIQASAVLLRPEVCADVDVDDRSPVRVSKATPQVKLGSSVVDRVTAVIEEDIVSNSGSPASRTVAGTPTKKPVKPKAMPIALAKLHRIAVPFFKELDETVFNRELGAVFLPDPPPAEAEGATPVKRKRGVPDPSAIHGLSFMGNYPNDNGSFELVWSNKMATTAGRSEFKRTNQGVVNIKVELGVKVVTNEERLRNTIAHEACHVASWAISGVFDAPHGATFKGWARKVMDKYPDIEITTKHGYEIDYKFSWKCSGGCGQMYYRHTNSIDITKRGCCCGSTLTPQFEIPAKRKRKQAGDTPKSARNASSKPRDSPIPLDSTRGRQGFPSSTSSLSTAVASDDDSDAEEIRSDGTEDIEDLTSAMNRVVI